MDAETKHYSSLFYLMNGTIKIQFISIWEFRNFSILFSWKNGNKILTFLFFCRHSSKALDIGKWSLISVSILPISMVYCSNSGLCCPGWSIYDRHDIVLEKITNKGLDFCRVILNYVHIQISYKIVKSDEKNNSLSLVECSPEMKMAYMHC